MYEIDFLPVGNSNGDAICIRHGKDNEGYHLHVVDGGYTDTADIIIKHIETHYGANYFINNMVLSHADNDHAMGLIGVMKHFDVKIGPGFTRQTSFRACTGTTPSRA